MNGQLPLHQNLKTSNTIKKQQIICQNTTYITRNTLLDQCIDEDILQQIGKNIRAALNLVEVNIIEASSRFNRISNEPINNALSPQKTFFSTQTHYKIPSTKITNPTNKQKHKLKQSLLLKLQSLNIPKSGIVITYIVYFI